MFCDQIMTYDIQPVSVHDKVSVALAAMEALHLRQLPVVEGDKGQALPLHRQMDFSSLRE